MAIIDARTLPEASEIEADLIIIGGGMAGIAIAREFVDTDTRAVVLESGGLEFDEAYQDLYRGDGVIRAPDNPDIPINDYLYSSRHRGLGGSGAIWGGKCVPLDPADFTERPWLPRTGWPMTRAELQPYYDRACRLLEIPLFDRDWDRQQDEERPPLPINSAGDFFSAPRCFSPIGGGIDQERFDRFRTGFAEARNIDVYLHANIVELRRRRRRGRRLTDLSVACLNGRRHTARARAYVLAAGGIENVRLLLASGFNDDHPLLGRCFMGHVTFGVFKEGARKSLVLISEAERRMALYTDSDRRDRIHCVLAATLEGQRRFGIGNFTATMSALVEAELPPEFRTLAAMPVETGAVRALAALLDQDRPDAPPAQLLPTFFMSEQLPNLESRITLDPAQTDALDMPRARLDWTYSQQDMDNLERGIAGLAAALGAENLGRLCWPVARNELLSVLNPSRHHMGVTRMARDRDDGVVDENCRMHGMSNLYIASVSTFPTSGIANPTLTLIALTMRLSDHLKRELGER